MNALTRTIKETIENVFNELQGNAHLGQKYQLREWAKENPGEFYRLAGRLIPTKLEGSVGGIVVNLTTGVPEPVPEPAQDMSDFA